MRLQRLLLLAATVALPPTCSAQNVDNPTNVGTPQNGLFSGGEVDSVQLGNGNLHIEIPLYTVAGRGLPYRSFFVLDTKQWYQKLVIDRGTGDAHYNITRELNSTLQGKFQNNFSYFVTSSHAPGTPSCLQGIGWTYNVVIREPNGTKHHLVPDVGPSNPQCQLPTAYYADDGSGFTPSRARDGTSPTMDTNGNQITQPSPPTGPYVDTLGRQFPFPGTSQYYDSAGNLQTVQTTTVSVPVHTNLCQWVDDGLPCNEFIANLNLISSITLPNGAKYSFTYVQNDAAEPSSITLPSGATVSWTYGLSDSGGPMVTARTVVANGQTNTSTYNYVGGQHVSSFLDPLGNETDFTWQDLGSCYPGTLRLLPFITLKKLYDKSSGTPVLTRTEQTDYTCPSGAILPIRVTTTWNQTNQVSKVETDYDSFTGLSGTLGLTFSAGNPVAKREYGWATGAPGNLLRRTAFQYLHLTNSTYKNANIVDRVTGKTIYDSTGNTCQGLAQACAQTTYSYDSTAITSTSGAPNHDYAGHGSTFTTRGNLTQISRWVSTTGTYLNTTNVYDDLGNLRSTTDPANNVTNFSYTDNFTDGVNRDAQAFVTQITYPTTNGVNHIEKKQYFWYTSMVAASCGQNFSAACVNSLSPPQPDYAKFTYDNMFRPLTVTRGDGGSSSFSYNDTVLPLSATTSIAINSGLSKNTTTLFDDLNRVKQTQLTSDQQGTVFTDTSYDALGRKSTVTNPHRSGSSPTDGTTAFFYDAFNRTCLLVPPGGTLPGPGISCPSTRPTEDVLTTYSGNSTTVTDEAGKSRKSVTDGLGRLTQVFEDPTGLNYETDYQYDALNNLIRVDQKGGDANSANWRTRTFAYDSLSRLLCAANPEIQMVTCPNPDNGLYTNGTARYSYDNDGNVLTKKSPKPNQTSNSVTVTATFGYDALNRLTSKSFDNGDPTSNYAYDGVVPTGWPTGCAPGSFSFGNAIGKRTAMCDVAGMELWAYSITSGTGWKTTDQRTTNNITKTATYQNNFAGSLATLTYPSTRVITYTQDGANRVSKAVDVPNSINYVTGTCANGTDTFGVCYTPPGSPSSFLSGASLASTFYYNPRLQPCRISTKSSGTAPGSCTDATNIGNVLDFSYNFNLGSSDNGNVAGITNNRFPNRSQTFTYDSLNRLSTAQTTATHPSDPTDCWGEAYYYDNLAIAGGGWGNLTTISSPSSAYTGCTQESLSVTALNSNRLSGFSYDSAGNLLNDGASNYVYNAENHITSGAGVTYTYDGDGKRVQKSNGKLYWYGMSSDPLDETDLTGNLTNEYIFFGRKRIARRDSSNNVFYYFADQLGTSRILVQSGQTGPCYDADFYPYGGERTPIVNSCQQNYKFTGKERDTETGLDNFGARHDSSYLGRFMSPDAGGFGFDNPESLNRYIYALNNPLRFIDPSGNEVKDIGTYFLTTFTQKSQEIDPFAWLWLLAGAGNGIGSRPWMKSVARQQDSFVLPGAAHPVEGAVTGAWFSSSKSFWSVSVDFREDPGGGMTASIRFGLKPGGQFLSDPLKNGYYEWRLSNMPERELTGVVFNLGSLTPEQLEALRNEAADQWRRDSNDMRYLQILLAVEAEQRKREEEERKRKERCEALPAGCGGGGVFFHPPQAQ